MANPNFLDLGSSRETYLDVLLPTCEQSVRGVVSLYVKVTSFDPNSPALTTLSRFIPLNLMAGSPSSTHDRTASLEAVQTLGGIEGKWIH